jgi:hypothetical protein
MGGRFPATDTRNIQLKTTTTKERIRPHPHWMLLALISERAWVQEQRKDCSSCPSVQNATARRTTTARHHHFAEATSAYGSSYPSENIHPHDAWEANWHSFEGSQSPARLSKSEMACPVAAWKRAGWRRRVAKTQQDPACKALERHLQGPIRLQYGDHNKIVISEAAYRYDISNV